ncbi:MAG: TauD/TfdA family dioxygenase [Terracidiphilus sp.]
MWPKIREEVLVSGYCLMNAFQASDDSITIATGFGKAITPGEGRLVQQLVPKAADTPNSYSGIYGLGSFPFHTDLAHWHEPPRYFMLRCVKGYAEVPTLLVDGSVLVREASRDLLTRALVKPRRPHKGAVPILRLYETTEKGDRMRWDEVFLQPIGSLGRLAVDRVRECLARIESQSMLLTVPGDTVLIDNWRMLHARSPILPGCEDRRIERVYLESLN